MSGVGHLRKAGSSLRPTAWRNKVRDMAEEERSSGEEEKDETGGSNGDSDAVSEEDTTQPGEWERRPSDPEDRRHDDDAAPPVKPSEDSDDDDKAEDDDKGEDDDKAEKEAGAGGDGDEGFDRPDTQEEEGLGDAGQALQERAEPLLEGPKVSSRAGGLPTRSLLAILAFVVVFCLAFFALWGLLGGIGILAGLIVGTALGLGAMKLLADRVG